MTNQSSSVKRSPVDLVGTLSGVCFVAVGISYLLVFVSRLHWAVAALLAVLFVAAAVLAILHIRQSPRYTEFWLVVPLLSLGFLTLVVVGAWVSYTIHTLRPGSYLVSSQYSVGTFTDYYIYTFLDLLPAINVSATLHLRPPLQAIDRTGGLPILVFKVLVVFLLFDAIRTWLKRRQEATVALAVTASARELGQSCAQNPTSMF